MSRDPKSDQLALFPGMEQEAPPRIRPWRTTLADAWRRGEIDSEKVEPVLVDLLRRNRELLKALKLAGVPDEASEVRQFREQEQPLFYNLVLLRREEVEIPEVVRTALETADELAEIRLRILEGLEEGGQSPTPPVTRRFGSEDDDGWFWNESPPTSVIGRVRLHGLAFVGQAAVEGSLVRTVVIPRELRESIMSALEEEMS